MPTAGHKQGGCQCASCEHLRAYRRELGKRKWRTDPEHRARCLERSARWQKENPERVREIVRRSQERHPYQPKARPCVECGAQLVQPRADMLCRSCRTTPCIACGSSFLQKHRGQAFCGKRCSASSNLAKYRATRVKRVTFPSNRVWFITCDQCDTLFTARRSRAKRCSKACAKKWAGIASREYQRRTHVTAIRYWRVAKTPEAEALAKEYYQLRQELRARGFSSQ